MNLKTFSLVTTVILSEFGCSTLPRPELASAGAPPGSHVAIASGPALVHISSDGSGRATLYLADDPGTGSAACPSAAAEQADAIKVLEGDGYVGDLPVPGGKRVCATLDSSTLGLNWLAEDYSSTDRRVVVAAVPAPAPARTTILLAKR